MDSNYTYCGEHLVIYIIVKSLCYTPETNTLYINYVSVKKKKTPISLLIS